MRAPPYFTEFQSKKGQPYCSWSRLADLTIPRYVIPSVIIPNLCYISQPLSYCPWRRFSNSHGCHCCYLFRYLYQEIRSNKLVFIARRTVFLVPMSNLLNFQHCFDLKNFLKEEQKLKTYLSFSQIIISLLDSVQDFSNLVLFQYYM